MSYHVGAFGSVEHRRRWWVLAGVVVGVLYGALSCAAGMAAGAGHGTSHTAVPVVESTESAHGGHVGVRDLVLDESDAQDVPGESPLTSKRAVGADHPGMACVTSVELRVPPDPAETTSTRHPRPVPAALVGCSDEPEPPVPRTS